jgi:hypothetical protein
MILKGFFRHFLIENRFTVKLSLFRFYDWKWFLFWISFLLGSHGDFFSSSLTYATDDISYFLYGEKNFDIFDGVSDPKGKINLSDGAYFFEEKKKATSLF